MCVCVWVYTYEYGHSGSQRPEEEIISPGAEVSGGCESSSMGSGTKTGFSARALHTPNCCYLSSLLVGFLDLPSHLFY